MNKVIRSTCKQLRQKHRFTTEARQHHKHNRHFPPAASPRQIPVQYWLDEPLVDPRYFRHSNNLMPLKSYKEPIQDLLFSPFFCTCYSSISTRRCGEQKKANKIPPNVQYGKWSSQVFLFIMIIFRQFYYFINNNPVEERDVLRVDAKMSAYTKINNSLMSNTFTITWTHVKDNIKDSQQCQSPMPWCEKS